MTVQQNHVQQLNRRRLVVWAISTAIACLGVALFLLRPANAVAATVLLAVAYLVSWIGIFLSGRDNNPMAELKPPHPDTAA